MNNVRVRSYACVVRLSSPQHGASIDMRDANGRTALFYSASQGHKNMVGILLDHNADIEARY